MPGSSPEGGRTAAAVASIACGTWPHAAAPSAAPPHNLRPIVAHTTAIGQPSVAQPCATISNRLATMRATITAHQPHSRATICATDCATLIATAGHHRATDCAKLTSTVHRAWRIHRQPAAQQLARDSGQVSRAMRDVAREHARAAAGGGRRPWRRPAAFSKKFCLIQSEKSRLDTIMATFCWDPDHAPRRGSGRTENKQPGDDQYEPETIFRRSGGGDDDGGGGVRMIYQCWTWTGPTGPGPTDEYSVHLHHRDFIVTPIADQIGPIDSVSETEYYDLKNHFPEPQCKMTVLPLNSGKPGIQLAVGPQPLRLRNHNSGIAHRIMVKRLATSPHDPLGITDSACKNQLVVVRVQYGPFNPYIPIRSATIGKSRVVVDPIAMRTSWRSNSDIVSVTRVSMTFRVVRTNQYNQDLGLIHSTNGNHLESPKEGSSIDHQVTIYLHAQNITMFPTNEIWYFASQILVSNSGGLILILTAQSTRNSSEYTVTIRCVS
ncbi:hypothetical protein F511_17680 [Dorcoceras hygrometricum]|uniref:Uncharacterized protein n=1 Tax=Dorcoceras hygrometricum TaxID=472368 RepID=A0A2Z7C036_9LAMI|nr:hypothetical protein F511_17680 [Dorcoceras hygrometricum]